MHLKVRGKQVCTILRILSTIRRRIDEDRRKLLFDGRL